MMHHCVKTLEIRIVSKLLYKKKNKTLQYNLVLENIRLWGINSASLHQTTTELVNFLQQHDTLNIE